MGGCGGGERERSKDGTLCIDGCRGSGGICGGGLAVGAVGHDAVPVGGRVSSRSTFSPAASAHGGKS